MGSGIESGSMMMDVQVDVMIVDYGDGDVGGGGSKDY
jgi:hypothetical protein